MQSRGRGDVFALERVGDFAPQVASLCLGDGANGNVLVGAFPTIDGNAAGNLVLGR